MQTPLHCVTLSQYLRSKQHISYPDFCLMAALQVAAELGREYEDTIALLEPDHDSWQGRLHYDFGYDAADGNPYPGDWITREVLEEPGMLQRVQEMAVADAASSSSSSNDGSGGSTAGGWGI
jgi:hypothetical protein